MNGIARQWAFEEPVDEIGAEIDKRLKKYFYTHQTNCVATLHNKKRRKNM